MNPIIHINKRFKIELTSILAVIQRNNKVYVKYADKKRKSPFYAIYRGDMSSILTIINQAKIMRGEKPILGEKE